MNYYFAYGLTIASNIDFPELYVIPPTQKPDVLVSIGNTPALLPVNENGNQVNIHITATEYLLFVNDAGSFYAVNGNEVIIEPIANADMKVVRIFFLSNAMAAILYQRKLVPIHPQLFMMLMALCYFWVTQVQVNQQLPPHCKPKDTAFFLMTYACP